MISERGYGRIEVRGKILRVHRLVAEAFVPNTDNLPEVNHIDGDKTNNHRDNLEWVSRRSNMRHAFQAGLCTVRSGERSPRALLTQAEVDSIRSEYVHGSRTHGLSSIGAKYGVTPHCIHRIVKRKSWAY
jgi:hypothetical protein